MSAGDRWKVRLQGHEFDLEDMGRAAFGSGCQMFKEGGDWFLSCACFDAMDTSKEVFQAAVQIVDTLWTVTAASNDTTQPVGLSGSIIETRADTSQSTNSIVILPGVQARGAVGSVTAPDPNTMRSGQVLDQKMSGRRSLYESNRQVRDAMDYLTKRDETFGSIYKAYEIVRDALGGPPDRGPNAIVTLANVTRRELDIFHENANIYALGGVRARHAKTKKGNPRIGIVMSVDEGRRLIRRVVLAWVDAGAPVV